jgi:hypothetical protein
MLVKVWSKKVLTSNNKKEGEIGMDYLGYNLATELNVAILWSVCKASPACLVLLLLQVRWIRAMYSDFEVFR